MVFLKVLKKFTVKNLCRNLLFNKSAAIDIGLVRRSPRHGPGTAKWQLKKTNKIKCFTNFEFYNFIIQSYMFWRQPDKTFGRFFYHSLFIFYKTFPLFFYSFLKAFLNNKKTPQFFFLTVNSFWHSKFSFRL